MSKLSKYIRVYEHPFQIRHRNGKGTVAVQFTDGYVTIHSVQPGSKQFVQDIHITRSAWIQLLKASIPVTRLMSGPDFDRYRAERVYARREQEFLQELREEKRQRRRPRRRR